MGLCTVVPKDKDLLLSCIDKGKLTLADDMSIPYISGACNADWKLNCHRTICQSMMAWLMERRRDSFRTQTAVLLLSEKVKCGMNNAQVSNLGVF